jgi:nickel-dependent lactate racemase
VTILVGTGSHRPHSNEELKELFGTDLMGKCQIISHDAYDKNRLEYLGRTTSDIPVWINDVYLRANKRIVIGFIEPHFFAGYSGGAKGICPAICGIETIMGFHSYDIIANPNSDYGHLEDNPQQGVARQVTSFSPPDFMINVTLNRAKEITGFFAGDYIKAHQVGARAVAASAMIGIHDKFPIVITTNSGYPLDQNLYQTVKGIWTASRIVEDGGLILAISECSKGIPNDGNFAQILKGANDIQSLSKTIAATDYDMVDRWQIQKLLTILGRAKVHIYSSLSKDDVDSCGLEKIDDISIFINTILSKFEIKPNIGVLPQGPIAVPFLLPIETGNKYRND